MRSSGIIRGIWRRPILRRRDFLCVPNRSATSHIVFHGCCSMKNNVSGHPDGRKNGKNYVFRGRNRQKTVKTANSVDGIVKKRKKLQIPWTESSKNAENCKFRGQNHQKTEKTAFPHPGESQNHPFSAFPHPGESQNHPFFAFPHPGENQNHPFSAFPHPGESQNHPFSAFPHPGESQNLPFSAFPNLGKVKNAQNCISQLWERQNRPKTAFPNLGKGKNTPRRLLQKKILIWHLPRKPAHACFFAK